MEPLNPAAQQPRRSPSATRTNAGFMGPPPARVGTASSYYADDQGMYARNSPGPTSPPAATPLTSPYDEPYGDYPYGVSPSPAPYMPQQYTQMPSPAPAPAAYTSPQYTPMPSAMSSANVPQNVPYRQPSPGIGTAMPYRQPSPGLPYRQPSPGLPYRQPSPGLGFAQPPTYRGVSPALASPASPPRPFQSMSPAPLKTNNDPGRPPSLLQSGRRPPNSFRDV